MEYWTDGYITDASYLYEYTQELNPRRLRLAFLNQGLVCPEVGTACELGFGQGLSANLHAAASTVSWWGTDFNPSQAGFAQELAQASGAGARLFDESFAEFCNRSDLPEFDFIGLHGIWSWISDSNRAVIVDFVRRKLKVGGVLYISYNTYPGWAAFAPMRHLMTEHAGVLGAEGRGIISLIDGALEFAERLLATNPLFSRANPLVGDRLKKMKEHNRHYLAHEYFNRDWHPMHFVTIKKWLEPAKLQYACSANYLDAIDTINLTAEQRSFLNEIPDPMFRQTTRDFMVNQQFRKDYWVKGDRKLPVLERAEAIRNERIMLTTHREEVPLKITGALGEATLQESVYAPILDALADHKPLSLAELDGQLGEKNISFAQVIQAAIVLIGAGHVSSVVSESDTAKAIKTTEAINSHLIEKARSSADVTYLASPVTGGGVAISRFHQLFLSAIDQGKKEPNDWAAYAWETLSAQGQRLIKEGKALESVDENLKELSEQAKSFEAKVLPVLSALRIAE